MYYFLSILFFFSLSLSSVFFVSCQTQLTNISEEEPITNEDTLIFNKGIQAGTLNYEEIDEASGMAISLINEEAIWTHNDSGDKARIFLISTTAEYRMTCILEGATNRDWEDIAIAKDPINGQSKVFVGDIGDNRAVYPYYTIYVFDEPSITKNIDQSITAFDKIIYRYSDGRRDAETLMVDPLSGDIYIVSKREKNVNVYQIKYPYNFTDTVIAEKVLTLPYTKIVAGDISSSGSEILLKSYNEIWHWSRSESQSIVEALSQTPRQIPYIQEPQGESICWGKDAKSFYTMSEESPLKIKPILYQYLKK